MKQNKIENEEINKKDNQDEIFTVLLSLLVAPFVVGMKVVERRATFAKTWRIFEYYQRAINFSLLAAIMIILVLREVGNQISDNNFKLALLIYLLTWIVSLPLLVIALVLRLQNVASAVTNGTYDLARIATVKRAILKYGFERAPRIFAANNHKLPKRSKSNKPVVAITSQSPDFRTRRDRRNIPENYIYREKEDGDFITFPVEGTEFPHHLVIGATGSGKTTLLSRMTLTALQEEYRVVFIDFKGGTQERELITGIGKHLDRDIHVVAWPGTGINLFTGTPEEIADRVIGFLPSASGGPSDFYRSRMIDAIVGVVVRSGLPAPKSADEIINRVYNGAHFAATIEDKRLFAQKEKGSPVGHDISASLASYLSPLRRSNEESTSEGFRWEDNWDLAFIQLNSTKEQYIRVGSAILHDFNFWVRSSNRYLNPKPILLIIDEAGVLGRIEGNVSLTDLIARARSSKTSVVLSSQTLSGIGEEGEEIIKTGCIRWVGRTSNPEEVTMAAGTKEVIETSYTYDEEGWSGKMSGRQQESFVISPTNIRHLETFYWSLSDAGKAIFVYAPPIM